MSKKNKALKQLIKSQIQAGAQGVATVGAPTGFNSAFNPSGNVAAKVVSAKEVNEVALIKKDIRLSIILIISVIVLFAVIYFIDQKTGILLNIATKLFKVLQGLK